MDGLRRGGRVARRIELAAEQKIDLERWARGRSTSHQLVVRAKLILLCAEGMGTNDVAAATGLNARTVTKWRTRFARGGTAALSDLPRPKTSRKLSDEKVEEILREVSVRVTAIEVAGSRAWVG